MKKWMPTVILFLLIGGTILGSYARIFKKSITITGEVSTSSLTDYEKQMLARSPSTTYVTITGLGKEIKRLPIEKEKIRGKSYPFPALYKYALAREGCIETK